jgi:5-methylcytosine-specific restriction protein B
MRIFFGKIKSTTDNKQIQGAYYETLSPMKLGDIEAGDLAFIISGTSIHLWKAQERLDIEGGAKMLFEVIHHNLPLNSKKFVAFKYFKLDSSLIVLTIRQSPKAFYQIELTDNSITKELLCNIETYENEENFRKIKIYPSLSYIVANSEDIQLFFTEDFKLQIQHARFFDNSLFPNFRDNLSKLGQGRKLKDKALEKIKCGATKAVTYTFDELPILRMYDAVFNIYSSSDSFDNTNSNDEVDNKVESATLELKSYNQIYFGPPGTGKTYLVRENFCLEEEVIISGPDKREKLDTNRNFWHLAPGRNAYLWNDLKNGNLLGYEWVDKAWGNIKELTHKAIEEAGWGSFQLITYLREVKKGDYICIISGRQFLGIAEVIDEYNYESAINNNFGFQTVPIKWLMQFEHPLLLNSSQTKTFVRLNHGKRWGTLLTLLRENGFYFDDSELLEQKIVRPKNFTFITFHQSFSYEDFIEGIKPVLSDGEDDEISQNIQYEIVAGVFYQACEKAAQLAGYQTLQDCLADSKSNRQKNFRHSKVLEYYLIIDELNRGNVASIFGELITLIEDDKRLGATTEITATLPYSKTLFGVPLNLRIIGTMNTADKSVEALDTALRRRFSFEEVLPNPATLNKETDFLPINLEKVLSAINQRLEKLLGRDYTIGHSFLISITTPEQLRKVFCNKIIPLLQEYFYSDYSKIGLVIGPAFLQIKREKTVFMKIPYLDSSDLEDKTIYNLKNIEEMDEADFIEAIKAIYASY